MTGQRKRRELAEAFEREAVERVGTSGPTIIAVAQALDVHEAVLRRWIARDGEPGTTPAGRSAATAAAGGLSPADLAAGNARLRRASQRAQMERGILEKAARAIVLGPMADDGTSSERPPDEVRARR